MKEKRENEREDEREDQEIKRKRREIEQKMMKRNDRKDDFSVEMFQKPQIRPMN